MLLIPDPNTAFIDPFRAAQDPEHQLLRRRPGHRRELLAVTPATSPRRPRTTSKSTGIADTAYFGPEAEFYIFDDVRFDQDQHSACYYGRLGRGHLEHRPRRGARTSATSPGTRRATSPSRRWTTTRTCGRRWSSTLEQRRHRDRAAAPRGGDRRPGRDRHAVRHAARHGRQADALQVHRQERGPRGRQDAHVHAEAASSRTTARACTPTSRSGRAASRCSSPRPATRACPTWPAGTSAACCTTLRRSSHSPRRRRTRYKRLVPGYEAPVNLVYSQRNRSAACRIPLARRARRPSGSSSAAPTRRRNPYLAFSAMLMAGLDGVQNRIEPPRPGRQGPLRPAARGAGPGAAGARLARRGARTRSRPTTTSCTAGGVFTADLIETWDRLQARATRSTRSRLRPHP